ncbi:bZIP transcription factor [Aspergillus niger]|nr:hypothetical protein CBS115988_8926 [Aspergillus niger]RDH22081.1 hypothetical protein M747DRAFT_368844 [Aspergillus niger ATCC 13496]GJP89749.1 bZIP transcription factor [Aspergillus niger]
MDGFEIASELLQASHHLPVLGTGSPSGSDIISGNYMLGYSADDANLSQFEQLEGLLGSPTVANHVDFGKETADLAFLDDSGGILSSVELAGMVSPPLDAVVPMPGITRASRSRPAFSTPASRPGLSSAKSPSLGATSPGSMDRSEEVKQLRKKYHEKYKERNRLAAGRSRQKQADLINLLQAEQQEEERRRKALELEIANMQKELVDMKQELQHHIRISNCMSIMSHGAHLQTLGLLAQDVLR